MADTRVWEAREYGFRMEMEYAGCAGSRDYVAYRFLHHGQLVFEGTDYSPSPLHDAMGTASVAGLLSFLSLRPGDTDREYFDRYTPEQLAWAHEHGETLGLLAYELEQARDATFAVVEYGSGFAVRHLPTGSESWLGDGVDALENDDGPLTPGTAGFTEAWAEVLNADPGETLAAYFPELLECE